jgi:hypothetical protein
MRISANPLVWVAVISLSLPSAAIVKADDLDQAMKAIVRVRATVPMFDQSRPLRNIVQNHDEIGSGYFDP